MDLFCTFPFLRLWYYSPPPKASITIVIAHSSSTHSSCTFPRTVCAADVNETLNHMPCERFVVTFLNDQACNFYQEDDKTHRPTLNPSHIYRAIIYIIDIWGRPKMWLWVLHRQAPLTYLFYSPLSFAVCFPLQNSNLKCIRKRNCLGNSFHWVSDLFIVVMSV